MQLINAERQNNPSIGSRSNQHRIALILRVVSHADLCSGCVTQRICHLLIGQKLGRFEIDAVQRISIKDHFAPLRGSFTVNYPAVGDPAMGQ